MAGNPERAFDITTLEDIAVPVARQRVLIIYNPIAGSRRPGLMEEVQQKLAAGGCAVELKPTTDRGDAEIWARELALTSNHGGFDAILVAGGDGTVNEALNGLQQAADAGCRVLPPMAILPLGTANVLAREIGLKTDADSIARTVLNGEARPVFCGEIDTTCEEDGSGIMDGLCSLRRFMLMAGIGLDAHVVENVSSKLKKAIGKGAYVLRTLQEIARNRKGRYRLQIEPADGSANRQRDVAAAILARGRFYGGSFIAAPEARLTDPALHVCMFRYGGPLAALAYGAALPLNLLPRMPGVEIIRARAITISQPEGVERAEPVQADGDLLSRLPATVRLARQPLPLVMPAW